MIVRKLSELTPVEWGNGLSRRFLVNVDGMGYSLTDTIVYAGTTSALRYDAHLEAAYCISGRGRVIVLDIDGGASANGASANGASANGNGARANGANGHGTSAVPVPPTSGRSYVIEPGTMYALDQHDAHYLIADPEEDLRLVCVFSPPLTGDERHVLRSETFSCY